MLLPMVRRQIKGKCSGKKRPCRLYALVWVITTRMRSLFPKNFLEKMPIHRFISKNLRLTARDTKLGKEEITRDIPNVSEEALGQSWR